MPPRTGRARSWAALAALPTAAGAVCVLLLCGAFSSAHPAPWALLAAAVLGALARWGLSTRRRPWYALEEGFVCALAVLALTQLAPPLQPLMYLLAGVAEVEEVLRGALAVAEAALRPHTVAVFLLSPDGESVRLRECASVSERLFRGPLSSREGAVGAVLSAQRSVRLDDGAAQI